MKDEDAKALRAWAEIHAKCGHVQARQVLELFKENANVAEGYFDVLAVVLLAYKALKDDNNPEKAESILIELIKKEAEQESPNEADSD